MSALGQKQTCAAHKLMSALPPKADTRWKDLNVRFVPKATCVIAVVIFAKRHRWTLGNTEQSFATFVSLT